MIIKRKCKNPLKLTTLRINEVMIIEISLHLNIFMLILVSRVFYKDSVGILIESIRDVGMFI